MIIKPSIDELLVRVPSKYALCVVGSRRARDINNMVRHYNEIGAFSLLNMASEETRELAGGRKKPLTKALEEVAAGDVFITGPAHQE